MNGDILNRYCESKSCCSTAFDVNEHYLVCINIENDVAKRLGKVDLQQFNEQLRVEAEEAERAAAERERLEQVR